jgi:predicted Zn-dependent peptidase
VSLILDEIERMAATGATEQEVKEARESLVNSYAFYFDTAARIAQGLMALEYRGLPSDYHQRYVDAVRNVTVADVRAVAKRYLKPDKLSIVVAGDPKTFEKPLDAFGKVTNMELAPPDMN